MSMRISPRMKEALMIVVEPLVFGGVGVLVINALNHKVLTEIFPKALQRLGTMSAKTCLSLGCLPIAATLATSHLANQVIPYIKYLDKHQKIGHSISLLVTLGSGVLVAGLTGFILSAPLIQIIFMTTIGAGSTMILSHLFEKLLLKKTYAHSKLGRAKFETPKKGGSSPSSSSSRDKVDKQEFETYKAGVHQTIQNLSQSLPNFNNFTKKEDLEKSANEFKSKISTLPSKDEMEKVQKSVRIIQKKLRETQEKGDEKEIAEDDDDALALRLNKLEKAFGELIKKVEGQVHLEKQLEEIHKKIFETMEEKLKAEHSKTAGLKEIFRNGLQEIKDKISLFQKGLEKCAAKEDVPKKEEFEDLKNRVLKRRNSLEKIKVSLQAVENKVSELEKNISQISDDAVHPLEPLKEVDILHQFERLKLSFEDLEKKLKKVTTFGEFIVLEEKVLL